MTELMKRYEAETGRKPKDLFMGSEESLIHFTREYVEWLEAQLTWRPVSEKPENADYYLVKTPNFIFKAYFDGEKFVKVVGQRLVGLLATHWLPIPPAPEGVIV